MIATITDRQKEIIEAAARLLTTSGLSSLTIKNLAKEMNFSEGAIYRHFGSKEDIIVAMVQFVLENVDRQFLAETRSEDSVLDRFNMLFNYQFLFFKNNPHLAMAIFSDGLLDESSRVDDLVMQIMNNRKKLLLPIITQGQKEGIFTSDVAADDLIHIIIGAMRLQMYKWRIGNFGFDIMRAGSKLLAAILKLIAA